MVCFLFVKVAYTVDNMSNPNSEPGYEMSTRTSHGALLQDDASSIQAGQSDVFVDTNDYAKFLDGTAPARPTYGNRDIDVRSEHTWLPPPLGVLDVAAVIFNKMVGTGIFTTPGQVLKLVGSKKGSLIMWAFGGVWSALWYVENWLPASSELTAIASPYILNLELNFHTMEVR